MILDAKWKRVQAIALYKAECLQKVVRGALRERSEKLRERKKELDEEEEEARAEFEEGREPEEEEEQTDEEAQADNDSNSPRTVLCTGERCTILRRLGDSSRLQIGRMPEGSKVGCTQCSRFRRVKKMVEGCEKALLDSSNAHRALATAIRMPPTVRVIEIAKTAHRTVVNEKIWNEPKRQGKRKTLAEHQTSGAKHLSNTVLMIDIPESQSWGGADGKIPAKKRHENHMHRRLSE